MSSFIMKKDIKNVPLFTRARIFKRLRSLAASIPWNRFLRSLKFYKIGLRTKAVVILERTPNLPVNNALSACQQMKITWGGGVLGWACDCVGVSWSVRIQRTLYKHLQYILVHKTNNLSTDYFCKCSAGG